MKHLIGLDNREYEHDLDRRMLSWLKGHTGFEAAVNAFLRWSYLKWHIVSLKGGCLQITPQSCPDLYHLVEEVGKVLDVQPMPELYTEWEYGINGCTTGYGDDTLMILKSGAVDLLTDDELRFVVGHEYGHIKSGHVIYHMMANLFNVAISQISLIGKLAEPVRYGLLYWGRMSEFTADRAGLLACQDIDTAIKAIVKMAGLPLKYFNEDVKKGFLKQAESFDIDLSDFSDMAIKTVTIATSSHPWTVMRAAELIKWYESGEYDRIINSNANSICIWPDCQKPIKQGSEKCPCCGRPQKF